MVKAHSVNSALSPVLVPQVRSAVPHNHHIHWAHANDLHVSTFTNCIHMTVVTLKQMHDS